MQRKRVSVICPTCLHRYRRVPRSSEFGMIHYGICKDMHPWKGFVTPVGLVTLPRWKKIRKKMTWSQVVNLTIRIRDRKLTKLMFERARLRPDITKMFDGMAADLIADTEDFFAETKP